MDDEKVLRIPRRGVIAMLVSVGAQLAILGALAPVLPLHVLSFGATPGHWGGMAAGAGLLMIFSEPLWGVLGDRWGVRRPYRAARLALALGLWLVALWPGLAAIVAWQVASGLFEPTIGVLGRGYIVRAYAPSRQTLGLSLYLVVYSASLAAGSAVGGRLYEQAGSQPVFLLTASLGTLAALASLFLTEPPPLPAYGAASNPDRARVGAVLTGPALILGLAALLQFVDSRVVRNFLVLLARERAGLDASAVGLLFGAFSLANVCFLVLLERFGRRIALAARVVAGLAMGALGMLVYAAAGSFAGFMVAVCLDALGWALASPARIVLVGRLSPPGAYGWALGLHGALENVGVTLGPVVAGALWRLSPAAAYQVTATLMAAGALAALRLRAQAAARAAPTPGERRPTSAQ